MQGRREGKGWRRKKEIRRGEKWEGRREERAEEKRERRKRKEGGKDGGKEKRPWHLLCHTPDLS